MWPKAFQLIWQRGVPSNSDRISQHVTCPSTAGPLTLMDSFRHIVLLSEKQTFGSPERAKRVFQPEGFPPHPFPASIAIQRRRPHAARRAREAVRQPTRSRRPAAHRVTTTSEQRTTPWEPAARLPPRPGSQLLVPHGEKRLGGADCEQAGEVHRVCASQGVSTGQVTSVGGDGFGQLDRPRRRPKVLPHRFGARLLGWVQTVSTASCGQRSAHLRIREAAGHCRIAAIPQCSHPTAWRQPRSRPLRRPA
jgi:hypothetical protein